MRVGLREFLAPSAAQLITESVEASNGKRDLFMSGIFIQGEVKNKNQRVYPVNEITNAVKTLKEKLIEGFTVLGEADHPDDLNINIERVSHMIVDMGMNGKDGVGKLKLMETPMGEICKSLIDGGAKLGVSSRGTGNVDDSGNVSEFDIVTVDIVADPSAPNAYPRPIYEGVMNYRRGHNIWDLAESVTHDKKAERHLKNEMVKFIQDLGRN